MPAVTWLDWNDEAFARADAEQKPVLLAIGATWCSSCAEMDRTSYADPTTVAIINQRFIPIKVDADRRPDINERYNLGGWPTTMFLTPGGEVLSGGTYVGRERLPILLQQVADAFATQRRAIDEGAQAAAGRRDAEWASRLELPASTPDATAEDWLCARILEEFDAEHGGFGVQPKLPYADALALAIERYRVSGDERLRRGVTATLDVMGEGGLYDEVDGGFFRYCMARDWTRPSSEKMLDGNAALLRVYLRAWETFEHAPYRAKAIDILRYVHGTLADPVDGGFFASQRADEQYYTLRSLDERRATAAPPVDHSLYADTNASMVMAYVRGARVLDDGALLEFAIKSLERVVIETYERGGGIAHHADETTRVRGLLADQVQVSAALLDVHDATDREAYLDMAQELMYYSLRSMWDDKAGGFFDRADAKRSGIGLLREPLKPFTTNCEATCVLAHLADVTRKSEFRDRASQTLSSQTTVYRAHGLMGAIYGLAARAVL